jgi:hypothetical protein
MINTLEEYFNRSIMIDKAYIYELGILKIPKHTYPIIHEYECCVRN